MELEENKPEFPTLEEWESMTVEDKVQLFTPALGCTTITCWL